MCVFFLQVKFSTSLLASLAGDEMLFFILFLNFSPGFVPIGQLGVNEGLVRGSVPPKTKAECEVLMMVGLPGSGKTYWAENWIKAHPNKKYNLLVSFPFYNFL